MRPFVIAALFFAVGVGLWMIILREGADTKRTGAAVPDSKQQPIADGFDMPRKQASQTELSKRAPKMQYNLIAQLQPVAAAAGWGEARMQTASNSSELIASLSGLDDPQEGYFYEGWLTSINPPGFISTGEVTKIKGAYVNTFSKAQDFSQYTQYVLTIEPDDGDPEPADHVLEGNFAPVN